jgi:hypothetical protein
MTHRVKVKSLNLRAEPRLGSLVLRSLTAGTVVKALEEKNGWVRVEEPANGWLAVAHLEPVRPAPVEIPTARVLKPMSLHQRQQALGEIEFVRRPTDRDPEAIQITNNFARRNVVETVIPQLVTAGASPAGRVWVHRLVRDQVRGVFAAWEAAGLLPLVLEWGGCYSPRLIRGSTRVLSVHAHGGAFDINMSRNGLGATPAAVGTRGSVRELVPLANEYGFYWGGLFTRKDGMHFEVAEVRG